MSAYRFALDQRVIVKEHPSGCEYAGVVVKRKQLPGFEPGGRKLVRYSVLDDADHVHTLIPAYWMRADEQLELIDQEHADALREAVNGGGI